MENRDKFRGLKKSHRPSHQMLASMRGNLRQMLQVPEENRSEAQHKAIIKITGALNHARNEQLEKGRKMAARIKQLENEVLPFENPAYVMMVLRALSCVASDEGYLPGMALKDMANDNPFMSSAAFDQLESLGHLRRLPEGALMIEESGLSLLNKSRRRTVS